MPHPVKAKTIDTGKVFGFKVDHDDIPGIESLEACREYVHGCRLQPSFIVQTSPSRFHVVFMFRNVLTRGIESLLVPFSQELQDDSECVVYSQLNFKLPGSINPKNGFIVKWVMACFYAR